MAVLEGIRRFCDEVGEGYSASSLALAPLRRSHYNRLYKACLLHLLGGREEEIHAILGEMEGHLSDGLLQEDPSIIGPKHDGEYVAFHLSGIYYQLVSAYRSDHPAIGAVGRLSPEEIIGRLDALDYSNSWYVSNIIMSYAVLIAFNEMKGLNKGCLAECSRFLDSKQDSGTGLWHSSTRPYLLNSMAGAFHYLPIYKFLGKGIRHGARFFDTVASLALPSGAFCSPNGYACLDYDGISSLAFVHSTSLREDERERRLPVLRRIAAALRRTLLEQVNPDGGFPEAGRGAGLAPDLAGALGSFLRHRSAGTFLWNLKFAGMANLKPGRVLKANSVETCSATIHESNTFATWFRYMTLAICEDILADGGSPFEREAPQRRFRLPGLGYL